MTVQLVSRMTKLVVNLFVINETNSSEGNQHQALNLQLTVFKSRGQSYKQFTLVIYDSTVVNMGYFPVRYDSRVVNYDHRGFIRLATDPPKIQWPILKRLLR